MEKVASIVSISEVDPKRSGRKLSQEEIDVLVSQLIEQIRQGK